MRLIHGDCIEAMDRLIAEGVKVDAVITDPPYGTTSCTWDTVIPLDAMWDRLKRIVKPYGAIVLFGSEPFSTMLRVSNIDWYKYDWKWVKNRAANVMQAKNAPLKNYEDIMVFSEGSIAATGTNTMPYYPQGLVPLNRMTGGTRRRGNVHGERNTKKYVQEYTNYPNAILTFDVEANTIHPTQKPVRLMQYLIATYTKEGETVLDFTAGTGSTGEAALNLDRDFIGIELDERYFNEMSKRLKSRLF